jgi:Kyakuja-Dileera-Zisupton transposase
MLFVHNWLQYDILPSNITERFLLVTSAMHAYAHQWSCQLVYNPRLRKGLGLSDGEGVERLWSKMRKLIGITRSSTVRTFGHNHAVMFTSSFRDEDGFG